MVNMFHIIVNLFRFLVGLFHSDNGKDLENLLLRQEVGIYRRRQKKPKPNPLDRILVSIVQEITGYSFGFLGFRPETILTWKKNLIKKFWTFNRSRARCGPPGISNQVKLLILDMKNRNLLWGARRIQGELQKLGIILDEKTVRNILSYFRRRGRIKRGLAWKKFLTMQAKSIYAMDFFTVDTILNQRFYCHFIIHHGTRRIVQFAVTMHPVREFVRQRIILFKEKVEEMAYMIHDRDTCFLMDLSAYGLRPVKTSIKSPNMNAIAGRFVRSVRRECLDWFIIVGEQQLRKLLEEYVYYYNEQRPHQGISQGIPAGRKSGRDGKIIVIPILGGLHNSYERLAA